MLGNQHLQTDPNNPDNKPDIIGHGNENGTCVLTDAAVSGDRNFIKKEVEIILKCKDLIIEIWCMWNAKEKVVPEIAGAT